MTPRPLLLALAALLLVVACAPVVPTPGACPAGEIPLEFGGCCPDADADGICDSEQDIVGNDTRDEEILEDVIIRPQKNTTTVSNMTVPVRPLSYTEHAERDFLARTRAYAYYVDSRYGELWVWWTPERTMYIAVENLFLWDAGTLVPSDYDYLVSNERFIVGIEDRYTKVLNYAYVEPRGTSRGCYVEGREYSLDSCIKDYPNGNPIIYYDFTLVAPENPVDWLRRFHGLEPAGIQQNRSYRTTGVRATTFLVDEVSFPYEDGEAKLYLHKVYGVPVQVDVLSDDGVVERRIVFGDPMFNPTDDLPWLPEDRAT